MVVTGFITSRLGDFFEELARMTIPVLHLNRLRVTAARMDVLPSTH